MDITPEFISLIKSSPVSEEFLNSLDPVTRKEVDAILLTVKITQPLIDKANELAKADFSSGFDEDCPMTTLAEALTFFAMENIDDDEVTGEDVYDVIVNALK